MSSIQFHTSLGLLADTAIILEKNGAKKRGNENENPQPSTKRVRLSPTLSQNDPEADQLMNEIDRKIANRTLSFLITANIWKLFPLFPKPSDIPSREKAAKQLDLIAKHPEINKNDCAWVRYELACYRPTDESTKVIKEIAQDTSLELDLRMRASRILHERLGFENIPSREESKSHFKLGLSDKYLIKMEQLRKQFLSKGYDESSNTDF